MTNIYLQQNYQNNLILHQEHLENGQKMVKLDTLDPIQVQLEVGNEFITLKILKKSLESPNLLQLKKQFVMQELVQVIKKKILKDKLKCSKKNTQSQKLLKTLGLGLTGVDQDLTPFWNKSTLVMSTKLWSPSKIDCVDLDSNLLNGSSKKLMLNSWYSAQIQIPKTSLENYQMIYLQSLQSLLPKIMDCEQQVIKNNEKKLIKKTSKKKESLPKNINSVKQINLKLTTSQKQTFKQWIGLQRWIYNQCLEQMTKNKITTIKELRKKVINNCNFKTKNQWVKNFHYDLRDEALRDLLKNRDSNLAKGNLFKLQFKSRKDNYTKKVSLSVLKKHWNKKNNYYSELFKPINLKTTEKLPEILNYDTRLVKTPCNKYYLCIQSKKTLLSENQANNIIFIDPGVKSFLTGYDPSGKIITFGNKKNAKRIAILLHFKRLLQSKIKKTQSSSNNKKRLALLRINNKIHNLITDLHRKASKWLLENYKYIYLPRLNFHNCKKLNKKSKSLLSRFRHCDFINLLQRDGNSRILEVNESYTSKTCSVCGNQHNNLKNKDLYECSKCNLKIGRDINASKNIMLRYFTNKIPSGFLKSTVPINVIDV